MEPETPADSHSLENGFESHGELNVTSSNFATVCIHNNILAFALYEESTNTIMIDSIAISLDDAEMTLASIKSTIELSTWLVHPKIVVNKGLMDLITLGLDGEVLYYQYKVLKSAYWNSDRCTEAILNKLIVGNKRMNHLWISTILDMENIAERQSLGALIQYMQLNAFKLDNGFISVSFLRKTKVNAYMKVDNATKRALQIFSYEFHPNVLNGSGKGKEGFSIFSLFDRTQSISGRQMLRQWLNKPYYDFDLITQRQIGIQFAVRSENQSIINEIKSCLKKTHSISSCILRIRKAEASFKDWCQLLSSLKYSLIILEYLMFFIRQETYPEDVSWVRKLIEGLDFQLCKDIYKILENCIDYEASQAAKQLTIIEGFDEILDAYRNRFNNLEFILTNAAQEVLDSQPLLQNVAVEYIPQVGYLVAIDQSDVANIIVEKSAMSNNDRASAINHFEYIFAQHGTYYYKNTTMQELDESIGDIKNVILDRQRELLVQVEENVISAESQLQTLSFVIATLDATISLGDMALQMKFVKPQIVQEPVILIKNSRHPLQELIVTPFIPNDVNIDEDKYISMISGPNASGKSVYLKQIGLLVYLAHIGSWIPCDSAVIGLTDRIFTRISSIESVSCPLSCFANDANQMGYMLSALTQNSLCLVDEFGKGTSPIDGIVLLAAIVKHFVKLKAKTVIVLHFTEILKDELLDAQIQSCLSKYYMDSIIQQQTGLIGDEESAECDIQTPLYKLRPGICQSSEGIYCANATGVPPNVIHRAEQILQNIVNSMPILPLSPQKAKESEPMIRLLVLFLQTRDIIGQEKIDLLLSILSRVKR